MFYVERVKMKKQVLIICLVIGVALLIIALIVGGFLGSILLTENVMRVERITIYETKVESSNVSISGGFRQDSALAYKGYKHRIADNTLYITIYEVLVSNHYRSGNFDIILSGDFSALQKIILEDSQSERVIWES